jgi:RNA polymerase sigma-70 factor (TIGR02960 family)
MVAAQDTFGELLEPHRRALHLHCYRMLGSLEDAEDVVQETLLSAWRGLDGFHGDAKLRTWLYRIATNACLNALRTRSRRPRVAQPAEPPMGVEPSRVAEPAVLDPYPDLMLDPAEQPDARYEQREAIELAFVTALHTLPARQRATLVLRDVLGFRAAEVAETLDTTEVAVNSALQRARAAIDAAEAVPRPASARESELAARCADAFERGDVGTIVALLAEEAELTMPPQPFEYHGREAICRFLSATLQLAEHRLVPTRANGQPAYAFYFDGVAHGLMVFTFGGDRLVAITAFLDTSVFARFGLPLTITGESGAEPVSG